MNRTNHIVQSPEWGQVKTALGTTAIMAGSTQYTKHKIPYTPFYYGYAPKVNPANIDFAKLKTSALEQNCIAINFDCPNITTIDTQAKTLESLLQKTCTKAARQTFAKYNVLLDITSTEEILLANMHHKTRYNIKYAEKKGITVREGVKEDIKNFTALQNETAKRQKFYIHPNNYYEILWETLSKAGIAKLLIAEYQGKPISCWMLFIYEGVLYYPYGGWSGEYQNLFPNNLVCWEAIKMGKKLGCHTFDMWGASKNPDDKNDPWHGFTKFKLGFGGKHVEYIESYDSVLNPVMYLLFNMANKIRWLILRYLKV